MNNKLIISGAPHVHSPENVNKIMWGVVIALIPTLLTSIYFFRFEALLTVSVAVASCLFFEWAIQKYLPKQTPTTSDGSAVITGLLLAFNLPSNLPIWMTILGSLVAIGIAKMAFGGLGKNPFNPALVARAFLLISFPVAMTSWPTIRPLFGDGIVDAMTGPTPFGFLKEGIAQGIPLSELMQHAHVPSYASLLFGANGGSLGEVSALAIILGGLYMLWKRIITWHIPVAFIGSAFVFAAILSAINPEVFINPWVHILSGGLMLGAVFMATDLVTSPMSPKGQLVFGLGCGVLTIVIRVWGAYPEGVSFAILIMNAFVPLIDRAFKPRIFGK
ncbi:MAG: RnfABCDGE type electron transport complex subunit D [Bacteroidales bacterium]|jgi:electron transport complex protein RnfD|nr:RnfABCDGE type electron transport complex subunit D [Bacteroidales bacterium]